MSAELALPAPGQLGRWVEVLVPAAQLAERIAGTEFVPAAMRGKPDVVTAAIMYGDELGLGPMQALAGIHVVEGRPSPSAELMRALILRAGHSITVHELTGELCRLSGLRAGEVEASRVRVDWSLAMARAAGLVNKQNWQRYPRAMLLARATGDLARLLFPDVIKGMGYVAEDVPGGDDLMRWADSIPEAPAELEPPPTRRITRKPRTTVPERVDVPVRARSTGERREAVVLLPEAVPEAPPEPEARDPWADPARREAELRPPIAPPRAPLQMPDEVERVRRMREAAGVREAPPEVPTIPRGESATDYRAVPPPRPIPEPMRRALMKQIGEVGVDPSEDRELRLALLSALLGHRVESTKELTRNDGMLALRYLADVQSGAIEWDVELDGSVAITRVRES